MRKLLATFALALSLFPSSAVLAQHKGARAGESGSDYSTRLSQESAEAMRQTLGIKNDYQTKVRNDLPGLNNSINNLTSSRESVEAQTNFFNALSDGTVSLRKKSDVNQWRDQLRKKWDAETGPRIGVVNPYTGESFYRYYSQEKRDKDGKLIEGGDLVVVAGDYERVQREREAWNQSFKRARVAAESLNNDYQQVVAQYGRVTAIKAELGEAQRRAEAEMAASQRSQETITTRTQTATSRETVTNGSFQIYVQFPGRTQFEVYPGTWGSESEALQAAQSHEWVKTGGKYKIVPASGK